MHILGIETSCDETAAAVLKKTDKIEILSNIISSSAQLQATFGGVIPEQAAREQIKAIIPVVDQALAKAKCTFDTIDAIAVTEGPGLIGSLLVGVETAKVLSLVHKKPLIAVNHLLGHLYANWINDNPTFPLIALLVSGGHTDLVYFKSHQEYEYLGGTLDDAAGECFDKCARLLGYPYPGGPKISQMAAKGNSRSFSLPKPYNHTDNLDFSYSGLKTAFANVYKTLSQKDQPSDQQKADLCANLEKTIVDSLIKRVVEGVKIKNVKQVIIAGGVAANQTLRLELKDNLYKISPSIRLSIPEPVLCTDNGAMIAARAFFEKPTNPLSLQANPNLSLNN